MKPSEQQEVDQLLAQAQAEPLQLPPGLMTRVIEDARDVQADHQRHAEPTAKFRKPRVNAYSFGTWSALGGMAAACCFGFWIGFSDLRTGVDPAELLWAPTFEEYGDSAEISGFGWDLQEG